MALISRAVCSSQSSPKLGAPRRREVEPGEDVVGVVEGAVAYVELGAVEDDQTLRHLDLLDRATLLGEGVGGQRPQPQALGVVGDGDAPVARLAASAPLLRSPGERRATRWCGCGSRR